MMIDPSFAPGRGFIKKVIVLGMTLVSLTVGPNAIRAASHKDRPFEIQVVDDSTGRGVPLVELRTVNDIRLVTDSAGRVAFDEPGLMDQSVFFHISSHGYEFPADGFGYHGKALQVEPGGRAELRIFRRNIAERLYRITGQGIYRDSTLLNHPVPIREPNLNGLVLGQDSVLSAQYNERIYWFWGDTNRPSYPLGNFHTPGAVSELPIFDGLSPALGVNLNYFVDPAGFARPTCQMPGDGPTWLSGLVVLGPKGSERMLASYAKIKPPLETYERGFVEWDDSTESFLKKGTFAMDTPWKPDGHPLYFTDHHSDTWIQFSQPFPLVRVPAEASAYLNIDRYESFTCLKPGSRPGKMEIERDRDGRPVYGWKPNTAPIGPATQAELRKAGRLAEDEQWICLRDIETGKPVSGHGGSVWQLPSLNPNEQRFAMIAVEAGGTSSYLGEVWYAEASTPVGPWIYARKVVTHDRYSFYNPKIHEEFSDDQFLYFEGTYTATFSGNPISTQRYEYNQVMYRLKRDDPRLFLPVAFSVDDTTGKLNPLAKELRPGSVRFLAPTKPAPDCLPVYRLSEPDPGLSLAPVKAATVEKADPVFYALPARMAEPPPCTEPLFEYTTPAGIKTYALESKPPGPGFTRSAEPLCRVWVGAGIW